MKKLKFILLAAVSLCGLLLNSCIKDANDVDGDGDAQIELELSTFAVNGSSDANAKEAEKVIKSAYVFIFNAAGVLENPGKTAVTTLNSNGEVIDSTKKLNATWSVYEGNKDIYVIANPDTDLADQLVAMSAKNGLQKSALEALLTGGSLFSLDVASFATKGMLMTGKVTATAVSGSSTTVPVTVTRRHARIDFMLRKAKDLEGATVVVKSVKYKNQIIETQVFPSTPPFFEGVDFIVSQTANNKTIEAQQATVGAWSGDAKDYTSVTDFYSFEKPVGTKAACLEMTVSIDGVDKLLSVYICSTAIGTEKTGNDEDKPVAIEANKVYKVMGTLTRQGVNLALNILEWGDVSVTGDIYGSDFQVSNSMVILDIINNTPATETINVSATQNISFEGYEYNGQIKTTSSFLPNGVTITGAEAFNGATKTGNITFTSSSGALTFTQPIYLWFKSGDIKKRVTFNIRNFYFSVTPPPNKEFPATGGDVQKYSVTSYSQLGTVSTSLAWTTEFSINGGAWSSTLPDLFLQFTTSGAASGSATKANNIQLAPSPSESEHTEALKTATQVTSYNLANQDNGGAANQNTANCYIVNAPGTYSLPLVYGNAIKGGMANTPAYKPDRSEGMKVFRNGVGLTGTEITDPYISITDDAVACLIWQDAPDLVSNVKLTNGKLTFTVNRATIREGNAVVGVKQSAEAEEFLWSWHIWVTDYELYSQDAEFFNNNGDGFVFMGLNLGWCYPADFPERTINVRFTQTQTGTQKIMDIKQLGATANGGNSVYYQWGRKDPFVGAYAVGGTPVTKNWWDKDGKVDNASPESVLRRPNVNPYIAQCIQNPSTFYYYKTYGASDYTNMWGSYDDGTLIKTIYDPSPVGYRVPILSAFSGFTIDGSLHSNQPAYINGTVNTKDLGWEFYKAGSATVHFSSLGWRDVDGLPTEIGDITYYWSSTKGSNTQMARSLGLQTRTVNPIHLVNPNCNIDRASGAMIQCVRE